MLRPAFLVILTLCFRATAAFAQTPDGLDSLLLSFNHPAPVLQPVGTNEQPAATASQDQPVTLPAGTHVLMVLMSPVHSVSGTAGSGLHLETLFPVIVGNQVVIPAHTYVQGMVEENRRPGHFDRESELTFHFNVMVFPGNDLVTIDAGLASVPGSHELRAKNSKGTISPVDQFEKALVPTLVGGGLGALTGSVRHTGTGTYVGGGLGAGAMLVKQLARRGDEISLPENTRVEMVLNAPLTLSTELVRKNNAHPIQQEKLGSPCDYGRGRRGASREGWSGGGSTRCGPVLPQVQ